MARELNLNHHDQALYVDLTAATRRYFAPWPADLAGYNQVIEACEKKYPLENQPDQRLRWALHVLCIAIIDGNAPYRDKLKAMDDPNDRPPA